MSTASHALPGKPSFGSLLARILFIVVLWALLVAGTLHYVGYVWPTAYQINQAEKAQAEEKEQNALAPVAAPAAPAASATTAKATAAAPASSATPAAPAASATAVAATPASTAAPVAPASTAAPVASAPKATGEQKLPFDIRLAGYNRTALENVSIFFSIVISVFCVGAIILQVFQYKRTEA